MMASEIKVTLGEDQLQLSLKRHSSHVGRQSLS